MRKSRQNLVRILNPITSKHFTSQKRAEEYVSRGRALWVEFDSIRFLTEPEAIISARESREALEDASYWERVVEGMKGNTRTQDVHFVIRTVRSPWSKMSGVQFRRCLVSKTA